MRLCRSRCSHSHDGFLVVEKMPGRHFATAHEVGYPFHGETVNVLIVCTHLHVMLVIVSSQELQGIALHHISPN